MSEAFALTAPEGEISKSAIISSCGKYRYRLMRQWAPLPLLPFIMLNPSTADADVDDPTIRRCMGFARRAGLGGITVSNLFAYRATQPSELKTAPFTFGPDNYHWLRDFVENALVSNLAIVCAWGSSEYAAGGYRAVTELMKSEGSRGVCLGRTKDGSPRHPLYVKADQPFEEFPI